MDLDQKIDMKYLRLFVLLGVLFCFISLHSLRAATLGQGWTFHRPLTVLVPDTDAPGKNIAWAEFYTNQARLPDGSDLRVTTSDRVILPIYIMRISPDDDLVRLAFQAPADGDYQVWWGNPHPDNPPPALQIDRGVLMQIFQFDNDALGGGWQQTQNVLQQDQPDESFFVPNIFNQFDPTGDYNRRMFLYTGQLHIAEPGTYTFAFDVSTMGYLNIDGQNILAKNRATGMAGRARFSNRLELDPGWHQVQVGVVQTWGRSGAALDWITPNEYRYSPVPASAFAPVSHASAGVLMQVGAEYTVDFTVIPKAQIFVPPENYFQRYSFAINVPGSFAPDVTWTFSDGQQATGLNVDHVFLTPGVYQVQAQVKQGANSFTATRRIRIQDQIYSLGEFPPGDPSGTVGDLINNYSLDQLSAQQLYLGIQFFEKYGNFDSLSNWGQAWANCKQSEDTQEVFDTADDLVSRFIQHSQYSQAAAIYQAAANKQMDDESQAGMLFRYATTTCDYANDSEDVLGVLQQWQQNHSDLSAGAQHTLNTALAFAAIANGNGKLAQQYVDAAGDAANVSYGAAQIRQGVLAHNVESYIATRDFPTAQRLLNRWDYEFPIAMTQGYTRLLRFELLSAQNLPIAAAKGAVEFVNAEPDSFYAAELLYRAAQAYKQGGQSDNAQAVMDKLKQNYPESPYAYKN